MSIQDKLKLFKDKTLCPIESSVMFDLLQKGDTKVHYCPDLDFMAISQQTDEFSSCTCYKIGFKNN